MKQEHIQKLTSFEFFKQKNNMRFIGSDEIVLECDNREKGFEGVNFTAINLYNSGYNFEIWYAKGQKSPHIHIKKICYLDLKGEQLKKYKKLFLLKYTPKKYLPYSDSTLCTKHLIAEENKPHFKYKTIKKLLNVWNADKKNFAERELIEEAQKEKIVKISIDPSALKLKDKLPITLIAQHYGLRGRGKMFVCPFHADKNPSLSLSDEKGIFYCFGCGVKGDLIKFVQLLEDLKNG